MMIMKKKNKHKLITISDLALHLGISEGYLQDILSELYSEDTKLYRSWDKIKPNGETRPMDAPRDKLKFIQKRINGRILQRTQISKIATGGVRGRKLKDNLIPHLRQQMVANFDLKRFFPNITNKQVYEIFILIGVSPDVARVLTRLTTFKNRIPQGAPTSSMLANLVAGYGGSHCLDGRIENLCAINNFNLRRWVDDISISGPNYIKKFEPTIEKIIFESGFIPNRDKTAFISKNNAQIITGHLVNEKANVVKQERRRIRAILHKCKTSGLERYSKNRIDHLKRSLRGKIAHISSINPRSGNKLLDKFNSIDWSNLINEMTNSA